MHVAAEGPCVIRHGLPVEIFQFGLVVSKPQVSSVSSLSSLRLEASWLLVFEDKAFYISSPGMFSLKIFICMCVGGRVDRQTDRQADMCEEP